jgi:chromosomal replication initiation ATPase DnaA
MNNDADQSDAPAAIRAIIKEVAKKHGFSYNEMLSVRRPAALCRARQEAYWRCVRETRFSLPTIGRFFGNRDHSTILKGARIYELHLQSAAKASVGQCYAEEGAALHTVF